MNITTASGQKKNDLPEELKTRFGVIRPQPDQVLEFWAPVLGFEKLRYYVILPNADCPPFLWLQAVEDQEVAFPLVDPRLIFPDYSPRLPPLEGLVGASEEQPVLLSIICSEDGKLGLNLQAPIIVLTQAQRAAQVVLNEPGLTTFRSIVE